MGSSVCRYASGVFARLLSCVWRATLPRHSYVDILTISIQRFDAQPALDVHEVSFLVFGTLVDAPGLDQCFYSAHLRGARGLHAIAA
jgi:hypothetical protein